MAKCGCKIETVSNFLMERHVVFCRKHAAVDELIRVCQYIYAGVPDDLRKHLPVKYDSNELIKIPVLMMSLARLQAALKKAGEL